MKLKKQSQKKLAELKPLLDDLVGEVENSDYIEHDPIRFMYDYSDKREREIAGFLAATMAWGRRDIVVSKTDDLLRRMDYKPLDFTLNYNQNEFGVLQGFKHRTFKPVDIHGILMALNNIFRHYPDFESFWKEAYDASKTNNTHLMHEFRTRFMQLSPDMASRTEKHISDPEKGSSCKRLWMYLRWCARQNSPVDTGIWNFIPASELMIPMDVHVARQSRRLGLLTRSYNDRKAVEELTSVLKKMDPADPVKYDYPLFGIGALNLNLPDHYIINPKAE